MNDGTPHPSPLPRRAAVQFGAFSFTPQPPPVSLSGLLQPQPAGACASALAVVTRVFHRPLCHFPCRVKLWASAFGGEIKSIAAKYSGSQLLQKVKCLRWQEAQASEDFFSPPAKKMEAVLVFQTNVSPREGASVSRGVPDPRFLGNARCGDFSLPGWLVIFR